MIKVNKGQCELDGTGLDLLAEFVVVIRSLKELMQENFDNEIVNSIITNAFNAGMLSDEELKVGTEILKMANLNPEKLKDIMDEISRR